MPKRAAKSTEQAGPSKKVKPSDTMFSKPDSDTDVLFMVENEKLYFNKALLRMCSPEFLTMFPYEPKPGEAKSTQQAKPVSPKKIQPTGDDTLDNKDELDCELVTLHGKRHDDMVAFLKQIHPVHSSAECITDKTIGPILRLADEYKVDSVRRNCEQYIDRQILRLKEKMPVSSLLLYFVTCEEHKLASLRKDLLALLRQRKMKDLKACRTFGQMPEAAMKDLAVERSLKLESVNETKVNPLLERILSNADCIAKLCTQDNCLDKDKCDDSDDCSTFCQRCIRQKIQKIADSIK